jgi:hypothetical protein
MNTVIPDLVDHVEEQEEEEGKASVWQEGEKEDGGNVAPFVRLINRKVYEERLTVAEFQKLEVEDSDPHCIREIFMNTWAVHQEHGVEVTRYRVLVTTMTSGEVLVADPTIQDLLNRAFREEPNPPKVIHILAIYCDLEEDSIGGTGGTGKGKSDKGKVNSEDCGQHDADGSGEMNKEKKTGADEEDEKKAEAVAEERRIMKIEYEYDDEIEALLATHAANKRRKMSIALAPVSPWL